ncbi:hypothetical protein ACSQ67_018386 [Phaseolus vulgaris]
MLGVCRILRLCQNPPRGAIFQPFQGNGIPNMNKICSNFGCVTSSSLTQQKGLENVTVTEMADNNIGSLVVLKPEGQHIAGIVTERENHIRHVPVIDGKIVGMISIVDVVRAVMEQQSGELKRLNDYIRGEYY